MRFNKRHLMYSLPFVFALLIIQACATPKEQLLGAEEQVKLRSMQSRAFDTTEKRDELSAAIHPYDLTCRPQSVNSKHNSNYETVLKSFESKTGIGGILNTSFNLHGFPIVYSPDIAINTFKNSELNTMSLGNYLVKK